ncbi:hypothetical protein ACWG8W_10410 [Citricoccus zhacaiensis]
MAAGAERIDEDETLDEAARKMEDLDVARYWPDDHVGELLEVISQD